VTLPDALKFMPEKDGYIVVDYRVEDRMKSKISMGSVRYIVETKLNRSFRSAGHKYLQPHGAERIRLRKEMKD
jgi:hypothetical protein